MKKRSFWENRNFKIIPYSNDLAQDLKIFCDKASLENEKKASSNMEFAKINYIINEEKRFQTGEFLLFYLNDKIIAVSGYHQSEFNTQDYFCGVRTYTLKEFEHYGIHSNFLLPYQIKKCSSLKAQNIIFVFNEYNEKLFQFMTSLKRILKESLDLDFKVSPQQEKILYKNIWQFQLKVALNLEQKVGVYESN